MKKISLITLQYINNYGSVLQSLASQAYLSKFHYTVEIINYVRKNSQFKELKKVQSKHYKNRGGICNMPLIPQLLTVRWAINYKKRSKVFNEFRKKYLQLSKEYSSQTELIDNPPVADVYCVGSDQVWNYLYNDGVLPEYYLEFVSDDATRFSLASSIGIENISDDAIATKMRSFLSSFQLITVREKSAERIIRELGYNQCTQIIDPTLLLNKNEWVEMLKLKRIVDYPYILIYQLNPCKEMDQFAVNIAQKKNCRIIAISNNVRVSISNAKIIKSPFVEEFLSLILYAKCIVTDSFHGTAFSINFNKEFYSWLPNKFSTRLTSILEMIGYEERAFSKNEPRWASLNTINYSKVNEILDAERQKVRNLLEPVLLKDKSS